MAGVRHTQRNSILFFGHKLQSAGLNFSVKTVGKISGRSRCRARLYRLVFLMKDFSKLFHNYFAALAVLDLHEDAVCGVVYADALEVVVDRGISRNLRRYVFDARH